MANFPRHSLSSRQWHSKLHYAKVVCGGFGAKFSPRFHKPTPLFEHVSSPIGRLDLVADSMRKRQFRQLVRKVGALRSPVLKVDLIRARLDQRGPFV